MAALAEGPFKVLETKGKTVVIEREDKTIERVSRDRVVYAPKPRTVQEIQQAVQPLTDEQLAKDGYPVKQKTNLKDIVQPSKQTDTTVGRRITRSRAKELERLNSRTQHTEESVDPSLENTERSTEDQEYVIERVVSHGINEDPDHPTASVGETTYQVRWYGLDRDGDTYEPIRHIPRNKIVSYYKRIKEPLPENLDQAQLG